MHVVSALCQGSTQLQYMNAPTMSSRYRGVDGCIQNSQAAVAHDVPWSFGVANRIVQHPELSEPRRNRRLSQGTAAHLPRRLLNVPEAGVGGGFLASDSALERHLRVVCWQTARLGSSRDGMELVVSSRPPSCWGQVWPTSGLNSHRVTAGFHSSPRSRSSSEAECRSAYPKS